MIIKRYMTNLRKQIIFLLLYLSGSKIPRNLKEIKTVSNFSDERIKDYQQEKLRKLLLHSWGHVPYYKKTLEAAGVVKNEIVYLENFNKIPILTKDIIRREGKNLYSDDYKKRGFYENTSGGSTGEPVMFIQDKEYDEWNKASKIYFKLISGQDIGRKELRLWGSERDLLEGKEKISIRIRNWLYNRREFNTFRMSEKGMKEYVNAWNDFKPTWIEAYVQSMNEFAKFLKNNKLKVYSPKGILTSAGTLYPEMRNLIEEVFECPVYNRYGSREAGDMAYGRDSLDISFWNQKLEILGEGRENVTEGNIIVTVLSNYSMPLIRYDVGDVGARSHNEFKLEKVQGRTVGIFTKRNGEKIGGGFFTQQLYFRSWCHKFQVIQKDYELIEIKIIGQKNEKDFAIIEKNIKRIMGEDCIVKFSVVNEIKPMKSGKYFYTISEIK